jgi:hypothetical protein
MVAWVGVEEVVAAVIGRILAVLVIFFATVPFGGAAAA